MNIRPVIASSYNISDTLKINPSENDGENNHHPITLEDNVEHTQTSFGSTSNVCVKLAQTHADYDEIVDDKLGSTSINFYKEGLPAYEEMIRTCPDMKAFEECLDIICTRHTLHVCSKGLQGANVVRKATVVFGEDITTR